MIFTETLLKGAFVIELEPAQDGRGMFARAWCQKEAATKGIQVAWVQHNLSVSHHKGTMRGMHYQAAPYEEVKLVQCIRGAIYDVMVDLRPESPTYCQSVGVVLSAENRRMLYIPATFAHGYITLQDSAEVFYHMSAYHVPDAARGFRWDDPAFGIEWPESITHMSDRDRSWPTFAPNRGPHS
ncbi:MAG: dTDP-4-dehydrorhamnose 3,5-epimerase [Nitrospira sp.]|nr:dTDP-4-dehydrorhamnose 3,5-epimerase [Nitrospira sp.]